MTLPEQKIAHRRAPAPIVRFSEVIGPCSPGDEEVKGGSDAMPDYELLELVLFRALPRRDTKELAKSLIARFGSFAEVVNAPDQRLKEVDGVGDSVITELRLIRAAAVRLVRSNVIGRPALSSWKQVLEYLSAAQSWEHREQFRVVFLDKDKHTGLLRQ